jgi:MFS family permease
LPLLQSKVFVTVVVVITFRNNVLFSLSVFAPFGQVGLAQGAFQVAFAAGSVLGPVIGGAFAVSDYRWVFWFNVPPSALCTLLGFIFIRNGERAKKKESSLDLIKGFDYIGSVLLITFLTL